jgi:hypothetical protein
VTVDGYWIDNWIYYNRTLKYNTTESLRTPSVLQLTTHSAVTVSTATALLASFANTILVAAELQVPFLFPWILTQLTHPLTLHGPRYMTSERMVEKTLSWNGFQGNIHQSFPGNLPCCLGSEPQRARHNIMKFTPYYCQYVR